MDSPDYVAQNGLATAENTMHWQCDSGLVFATTPEI